MLKVILLFIFVSGCTTKTHIPSERFKDVLKQGENPCYQDQRIEEIKIPSLSTSVCDHIIRVDKDGEIITTFPQYEDVSVSSSFGKVAVYKKLEKEKVDIKIRSIFDKAEKLAGDKEKVEILIYIHGGLNSYKDTNERVFKYAAKIMTDGKKYPIFISWPSDTFDTYFEQVTSIREGHKRRNEKIFAPFVLASDILQSIARMPRNWYYQLYDDYKIITDSPKHWKIAIQNKKEFCNEINKNEYNCAGIKFRYSQFYSYGYEPYKRWLIEIVSLVPRLTIGTIGAGGEMGIKAWKNMKRRTNNFFLPQKSFSESENGKFMAGKYFFEQFFKRSRINDYRVTLIGHSMGAFVINKTLRTRETWRKHPNVLNEIVYLGAACSINDAILSVFSTLSHINRKKGREKPLKFYNLMLNRIAEITEENIMYIAPKGSLLTYIDQYYEIPETPLYRTLGSEINVLYSLPTLINILGKNAKYVEFKAFDRFPGYIPSTHGELGRVNFWEKEYWDAFHSTIPPSNCGVDCDNGFNAYAAQGEPIDKGE